MSDLIERLREWAECENKYPGHRIDCLGAADALEAMRQENERLEKGLANAVASLTRANQCEEVSLLHERPDLLIERLRRVNQATNPFDAATNHREAADALEAMQKDKITLMQRLARRDLRVAELEANRPTPDNNKILSEDLPTAIKEYLRVCGPDLKWNAYHLLSEAAAALKGEVDEN